MKLIYTFIFALTLSGCAQFPFAQFNKSTAENNIIFPQPQGVDLDQVAVYQDHTVRSSESYARFSSCVDENLNIYKLEEVVEDCRKKQDISKNYALLKHEEVRIKYLEELTIKFFTDQALHNKNMDKDFQELRLVFKNIIYNLEHLKNLGIEDAEFLQGYLLIGSGVLLKEFAPEYTIEEAINRFESAFHNGHEEASTVLVSLYLDKSSGHNYSIEDALLTGESAINKGMLSTAITMFFTLNEPETKSNISDENYTRIMNKIDALMYKASLSTEHKQSSYIYLAEKYWNGWQVAEDKAKAVEIYKKLDVKRDRFLNRIQMWEEQERSIH